MFSRRGSLWRRFGSLWRSSKIETLNKKDQKRTIIILYHYLCIKYQLYNVWALR
jgi:hypothetical protein